MTQATLTPVLSRTVVPPKLASRGMRSAAELALGKPCGTRVRYYAGCRCDACKGANTAYERERALARKRGEGNGLVSAESARAHLAWLSAGGVGRAVAADVSGVARSIISLIVDGHRPRIRRMTEKAILSVTLDAAADRAYIDGAATWVLMDELLGYGCYSKAFLASEILGRPVRALQLTRHRVTVRNAERVRRVYARLRLASQEETHNALCRVVELREEGFRPERILTEMRRLAHIRGLAEPTLQVHKRRGSLGCLRHYELDLIERVYRALMGVDE